MRNNLGNWLKLLRLCSSLTLLAFAALIYFYPAEVQGLSSEYLPWVNAENSLIIVKSMAGFFALAAALSWRCGGKSRPLSALPVFIAGILLLAIFSVRSHQSGGFTLMLLNALVIACPFLLLGYCKLQNKVDHWCIYASVAISLALLGQSLYGTGTHLAQFNYLYLALTKLGLTEDAAANLIRISGYVHYGFILALFIPALRRIALYAMIAWGISTAIAPLVVTIGSGQLGLGVLLAVMRTSHWMIPLLILLTLASQKKTATLKL